MQKPDPALVHEILTSCGRKPPARACEAVAGGNINSAWILTLFDGEQVFLKLNHAKLADMFAGEVDGLKLLGETSCLRVPWPIGQGVCGDRAWLLCEYLRMEPANSESDARLGEGLAQLHSQHADSHGWHRDNHIGLTPQINTRTKDWIDFFGRYRLGQQFNRLQDHSPDPDMREAGYELIQALPQLLDNHQPAPSLLHGDLWFGNRASLSDGTPVIFDPACHYGDPDCDIAMTELFGGFSSRFYSAYRHHRPEAPGYATRRDLYQLYHTLNHANLFGGQYHAQARSQIQRLLSQL